MIPITTRALLVALLCLVAVRADDWPQWMGPKRDAVWRETGILEKFPEGGPRVLWRTPIKGGYAGPAVADGRVFVLDFDTAGDVKAGSKPMGKPMLKGTERVLCLDAKTGKELWKHEYDATYQVQYPAGPRCTPTVDGERVYTLGTMGDLLCLEVKTGKVVWSKNAVKDFGAKVPIWGFTSHPLVDGKKLFVTAGGKDGVAVALDKATGKVLWQAVKADEPGYAPPTIIEAGGKRQLLVWPPKSIHSLDPETGKEHWSYELEPAYGMSIMAPRQLGDYLFAGGIGWKSALLKLDREKPGVTEVWTGTKTTSISPVNMTPFLEDGMIYGVDQPGELRGVDLLTGKRLWQTYNPTTGARNASSGTGFLVKNGDRFFIFGETGRLTIARLSRKGYEEIDRAQILEPTSFTFGRNVVWSHPAFANQSMYARNDREIVRVSLAK